ncbi:MAG: hypothetical protein M1820_005888 [Bogoriella megaspora]|nr:MAG: hypothetical protein M1820_005888 [Bogoriella megaspora]
MAKELAAAHQTLFEQGLQIRYDVAGKEYVDRSLAAGSSSFARPMQEFVTEACWGSIWSRPGLERKQRSLLNIAMLCALNRSTELAVHVKGAVNNGATEIEIRETLLQAACYCGMPAGIEGFKVAEKAIEDMKKENPLLEKHPSHHKVERDLDIADRHIEEVIKENPPLIVEDQSLHNPQRDSGIAGGHIQEITKEDPLAEKNPSHHKVERDLDIADRHIE